jgi:hypothetical protein
MLRLLRLPFLFLVLLIPARAFAQGGQYGSIEGFVYDQTGAPLKGVKLTAKSDTQIGGAKVAYSNDEGHFRFPLLQPGIFELVASAPKLQTQIQKDIKVGINAASEVNMVLEVQTAVEEVKVVQKPPIVATNTAHLKEDFDIDFVQSIPLGSRDGVYASFLNEVGGVNGGAVRGGTPGQTLITMDGFDLRGQSPTLKAAAAYEISVGGYGAENAMSPGGMVNLVSRSGSNRFEFEFNATYQSNYLRFFTDAGDNTSNSVYNYFINPTISGPIIRDRLWFSLNVETYAEQYDAPKDPNGYLPDTLPGGKVVPKGTLKLTWQINGRNKLQSVTNFDLPNQWNQKGGLGYTADSQENRHGERIFEGLIWESLLSDNLVFRSQVGVTTVPMHTYPRTCESQPVTCDHIAPVQQNYPVFQLLNNSNNHDRNDDYSLQFRNRLEWFLSTKSLGEHNLTVHDYFFAQQTINRNSKPGDQLLQYNGPDPQQITYYYSNDPRLEAPRYGWYISGITVYRHLTTAFDSWRLTRYLTLTPAISHILAGGSNSSGDTVASQTTIAPSMALAWDATHDGRTVVRSSFNAYADVDASVFAGHTLRGATSQNCKWNATTQAFDSQCTFSGGQTTNTFGLPCGPNGLNPDGTTCKQSIGVPRTWEYTFGAEREVIQGLALSADLSYRKFLNQYERVETNRVWNSSGTGLDPTASFRNGRTETISDLETPADAQRRYVGATLGIKKREGRLKIFTYYTLSSLSGNIPGSLDGTYGQIPQSQYLWGYMPADHRHEVKMTGVYQATNFLTLGARYEYLSGQPYNHWYRNDVTGGFNSLLSSRGTNPGGNINDPIDDRQLRLPDIQSFNLQVRINWLPLIGQRFDTYIDWLNVLALRTQTGVNENDGPAWGTPNGNRMGPMFIRFGINYRY